MKGWFNENVDIENLEQAQYALERMKKLEASIKPKEVYKDKKITVCCKHEEQADKYIKQIKNK